MELSISLGKARGTGDIAQRIYLLAASLIRAVSQNISDGLSEKTEHERTAGFRSNSLGNELKKLNAERILNEHGNSILRLAYSYLHNMGDAEDIVQDTMIKYLSSAPEFESGNHEKAWLLRVAANLCKNKLDYNKIRECDELEDELAQEGRTDLTFVWEAVKTLPEKYREVIHLYYHEGYQTSEIAEILSRNESSVRSDMKRGREKLKEILKEAYDFE